MCSNLYKVLPGEISVFIYRLISLFLFVFYVMEMALFTSQPPTCFYPIHGLVSVIFLFHLEFIFDKTKMKVLKNLYLLINLVRNTSQVIYPHRLT